MPLSRINSIVETTDPPPIHRLWILRFLIAILLLLPHSAMGIPSSRQAHIGPQPKTLLKNGALTTPFHRPAELISPFTQLTPILTDRMPCFVHAIFIYLVHAYFHLVSLIFGFYNQLLNSSGPPCSVSFPNHACPEDAIYFLSATEAAKRIREGRLTSMELVTAYVNRIRSVNEQLNAVVHDCGGEALGQVPPSQFIFPK